MEGQQSWHYDTPLIPAFYAGPKHYSVMTTGRQGLLEHGQRRSIRRGRRTVYGTTGRTEQRRCSGRRRRAVGTAGPFEGLRADREQRTPPSTPPGPQYLSRNYWQDGSAAGLCRSIPRQADDTTTRPSGSGPMRQSAAQVFGPSYYTPINRQGSGRVEPNHL